MASETDKDGRELEDRQGPSGLRCRRYPAGAQVHHRVSERTMPRVHVVGLELVQYHASGLRILVPRSSDRLRLQST